MDNKKLSIKDLLKFNMYKVVVLEAENINKQIMRHSDVIQQIK